MAMMDSVAAGRGQSLRRGWAVACVSPTDDDGGLKVADLAIAIPCFPL